MTNEMVERLTGSLWMVTKPGTDMNCLGRVYRDKGTAFTHKDYDETVVELRLAEAHEPLPVAARDADHCDYPDCEQHWTNVVAQARALLEPLAEHDPAIRQWLKTPDLPSLGASRDASTPHEKNIIKFNALKSGESHD